MKKASSLVDGKNNDRIEISELYYTIPERSARGGAGSFKGQRIYKPGEKVPIESFVKTFFAD